MAESPEPISPRRRLSVSIKMGAVFLLLAIIASGNLYLFNTLHEGILDIAGIINQSGRLRYLSQQFALQSANFVLGPDEAARQKEVELEYTFITQYAGVAREIGRLHPLMRSTGDNLEGYLEQIDSTWQRQHTALEQVMTEPDGTARRIAEMHGGSIAADSTPGQGSRFTVQLPRRLANISE